MRRFENGVAAGVDPFGFALGIAAPQQEDHPAVLGVDRAQHGVGELLPAFALVRVGLVRAHGQHGIQQQHPLLGPGDQAAVVGHVKLDVLMQFLEDIDQRRRSGHARAHRKCQPLGLVLFMIRILADDHHAHLVEGRVAQGVEYILSRGINFILAAFLADKSIKLLVVGLGGFADQGGKPAIWNGHAKLLAPAALESGPGMINCIVQPISMLPAGNLCVPWGGRQPAQV